MTTLILPCLPVGAGELVVGGGVANVDVEIRIVVWPFPSVVVKVVGAIATVITETTGAAVIDVTVPSMVVGTILGSSGVIEITVISSVGVGVVIVMKSSFGAEPLVISRKSSGLALNAVKSSLPLVVLPLAVVGASGAVVSKMKSPGSAYDPTGGVTAAEVLVVGPVVVVSARVVVIVSFWMVVIALVGVVVTMVGDIAVVCVIGVASVVRSVNDGTFSRSCLRSNRLGGAELFSGFMPV